MTKNRKKYNPCVTHLNCPVEIILGDFGPHVGKVMCKKHNKFIQWASKKMIGLQKG